MKNIKRKKEIISLFCQTSLSKCKVDWFFNQPPSIICQDSLKLFFTWVKIYAIVRGKMQDVSLIQNLSLIWRDFSFALSWHRIPLLVITCQIRSETHVNYFQTNDTFHGQRNLLTQLFRKLPNLVSIARWSYSFKRTNLGRVPCSRFQKHLGVNMRGKFANFLPNWGSLKFLRYP